MYTDKLDAVQMFRADMIVRLVVNATRFQQGRLILAWLPSGGSPISASTPWAKMHMSGVGPLIQKHHVELDLSQQTEVSLLIPYQSINPFRNVVQPAEISDLGLLVLRPYSPLVTGTGGGSDCPFTLWFNFTNITLSGATLQAGIQTIERASISSGVVSGPAGIVAQAATLLGKIPLLTSIMRPVSWAASLLEATAKHLGFSRPIVLGAIVRHDRSKFFGMTNSEGTIAAVPLGLSSENEIAVVTGAAATEFDQMSFAFIKSQFGVAGNASWSTATAPGTTLVTLGHNPFNFFQAVSNGFSFAPVTFLSRNFSYWRGGLVFRFKFVKTEFHSGRLAFSYFPRDSALTTANPSLQDTNPLWREIIDVRTTCEVEFCVPYISEQLWKPCDNASSVGSLVVHVVETLNAPTAAPSSITILVEVAGAEDLSFALPKAELNWQPYSPATLQASYMKRECAPLGEASVPDVVHAHTMGELIFSVRQLLKGASFRMTTATVVSSAVTVPNAPYADGTIYSGGVIRPFMQRIAETVGVTNFDTVHIDRIDRWGSCYAFSSGSVLLCFHPVQYTTGTATTPVDLTPTYVQIVPDTAPLAAPGNLGVTDFGNASPPAGLNSYLHHPNPDGSGFIVSVPGYSRFLGRSTASLLSSTTATVNDRLTRNIAVLVYPVRSGTPVPTTYNYSRIAGDDLSFTGWVGVPLMRVGS
jgi:hypothetical protein